MTSVSAPSETHDGMSVDLLADGRQGPSPAFATEGADQSAGASLGPSAPLLSYRGRYTRPQV